MRVYLNFGFDHFFHGIKAILDLDFFLYNRLLSQVPLEDSVDFLETLQVFLLRYEDVPVSLNF